VSKVFQEYLLRLVDSRDRQLNSVVNEMCGIMLRNDAISRESLEQQARIEALSEEMSTLRLLHE
ncbi:hypothetical protein MKW98_027495, partial [Papaver atlanticum]